MDPVQLELARQQIRWSRDYTNQLIDGVPDQHWFETPLSYPTHIAWQVGHLAMAEYGLTMLRIRGREPDDEQLIPKDFLRLFKKSSVPSTTAGDYPPVSEIQSIFHAVHEASLVAMTTYQPAELEESLPAPTAVYPNKLGSLFMCSAHEMLHAGQIGMLRRALGHEPLR